MPIGETAGKRKTIQKARLPGQRKDVEKRQDQKIVEPLDETPERVHRPGRSPHTCEPLAADSGGQTMAKACGQCSQNPSDVDVSDVVRNDQHRSVETAQLLSANDFWGC